MVDAKKIAVMGPMEPPSGVDWSAWSGDFKSLLREECGCCVAHARSRSHGNKHMVTVAGPYHMLPYALDRAVEILGAACAPPPPQHALAVYTPPPSQLPPPEQVLLSPRAKVPAKAKPQRFLRPKAKRRAGRQPCIQRGETAPPSAEAPVLSDPYEVPGVPDGPATPRVAETPEPDRPALRETEEPAKPDARQVDPKVAGSHKRKHEPDCVSPIIRLHTAGYYVLGMARIWKYKNMRTLQRDAEYRVWKYNETAYSFHEVLICTSPPNDEVAKDARYPGHWGENSENMVGILGARTFRKNIERVKQVVEKAKREGQGEVNVLFLCRMGRHRSVSTSRLISYALQVNGFNHVKTEHLVCNNWPKRLCRDCPRCKSTCELKPSIIAGVNELRGIMR